MISYFKQNETLIILCVEGALIFMGVGLVSPILPQYARSFEVNMTLVGLVITIHGVARLMTDIPVGRLSEKLGRRPILVAGPIVVAIGSLGCGLASEYWELLVFRFIQGVGSAMFITAAMIMLADISTPANRGQVMSLNQGSHFIGIGLGPMMGGFIAQYFGLQAPFFGYAFFAALAALWAYLRIPESRPESKQEETRSSEGNLNPPPSSSRIGLNPLLLDLNFILISMVTFGNLFKRIGAQNQILPLLASDRLGLSAGPIGIALTIIAIVNLIALFASGPLSDRFGRKAIITPAGFVAVASLIMLAQTHSYWFLILTCVVWGIGTGLSGPVPAAYVSDILPKENYSSGLGLYRTISDLGLVAGPILMGWLADMKGFAFSLMFNSLFLFLATLLFQILAVEPVHHRRK
jgi:MFS family permease